MTTDEAAALLGVEADTVRQQIRAGRIKARKVGRDWNLTRADVERYRHSRRTKGIKG